MKKEEKIELIVMIIIILISILTGFILYKIYESISKLEIETNILQTELSNKEDILNNINFQLTTTHNEINQLNQNLKETINELEKRKSGARYTLHDPLYSEVRNFLRSDRTNTKPYDDNTFNCANYAQEVNNNAEKIGIRCAFVAVNLSVGAHALVGFNTIDIGLVYFEPQNDYEVKLQVGKEYWADCVIPPSGYYYKRDPTWKIEDFTIYW